MQTIRRYSLSERRHSKGDERRQLKIAKLMLIVISAFLISWTPYACVAVIWQFVAADSSPHPDIVHAAAIFGKMFVIWNPIISRRRRRTDGEEQVLRGIDEEGQSCASRAQRWTSKQ
jgi:hypothetical protein